MTLTPCFSASASFEPAPGPATTRSVFFDTLPETLAPSAMARALASSRVIFSSVPVKTTVKPDTLLEVARLIFWRHLFKQTLQRVGVVLLSEEIDEMIGGDGADAVDAAEFDIVVARCMLGGGFDGGDGFG